MHHRRINAVRARLQALKLQALLVTDLTYVRYLTGFSGSNGICVVLPGTQYLITDRRYLTQAPQEVKGFKILIAKQSLMPLLHERKIIPGNARVGFEGNSVSVEDMNALKRILPGRRFIPAKNLLDKIASVKDAEEIELIRKAVEISDKVFEKVLELLRPGLRENDISAEISYWHKKYGAEGDSFDPIVASGHLGALPHARASDKIIRRGEMIVLDFGCKYRGYCSDITRTVSIGKPSARMKKIYGIVLDAQLRAIESIRSGVKTSSIDRIARNHIRQNNYGRYFIHSLGHGLGMKIHEPLRLSLLSKEVLEPGNVVTVEPGIYIPGLGGVRIEDDVVVEDKGCSVLTKSPKELITV
jgi:Xaa-Pro aminopeptidase